ncbi:MAG: alpha/beta hydrolase [Gammaproteobacteria bacterium]|nr:alpha/beta hydrolase [Gammaproteobacteria bacterium]
MPYLKYAQYTGLILLTLFGLLCFIAYSPDLPTDIVDARYRSATSQFLLTDTGVRIHFRDEGNENGRPIILIHGAFSSLHAFEAWSNILGDQYRIISLDLPGHGLTGATPGNSYSNDIHLQAVHSVSQHLQLNRFTIGGNSMGGGVSWRYALKYPERIDAVILIASSGPMSWYKSTDEQAKTSPRPLVLQLLEQAWFRTVAESINPYYLVKWGLASAYHQQQSLTEMVIQRYTDMILRDGSRKAILSRSQSRRSTNNQSLDPSNIKQPVLILWGQEDLWIEVSQGRRLTSIIDHSQLIVYPDVGHLPMEEIPNISAKSVRNFLSELNPGKLPHLVKQQSIQ